MDEFQGMTVPQLREFLNSRGSPNAVKRRQELETHPQGEQQVDEESHWRT